MEKYSQEILNLNKNDLKYYYRYYLRLLNHYSTYEEAFEAVERVYFNHFDKHRFESYESFMAAKSRYLKQQAKNK